MTYKQRTNSEKVKNQLSKNKTKINIVPICNGPGNRVDVSRVIELYCL